MIHITIETDNAAFGSSQMPRAHETARILRELADKLDNEGVSNHAESFKVRDINGNTVGRFEVRP